MDNGREEKVMPEYKYEILRLRLEFLERFRTTSSATDNELRDIIEFVDEDCQMTAMLLIGGIDYGQ